MFEHPVESSGALGAIGALGAGSLEFSMLLHEAPPDVVVEVILRSQPTG